MQSSLLLGPCHRSADQLHRHSTRIEPDVQVRAGVPGLRASPGQNNRVRGLVDLPLSEMTGKLQASVDQTQQYFDVHLGFLLGDMV